MFRLAMLPARQGDCLWFSYGSEQSPHHLVIDGGPERSRVLLSRVEQMLAASPNRKLHIDLLVVTHVDNDHIGGVLELLENLPTGLSFSDIWFNAYRHLLPPDRLGPDQGERLAAVLDARRLPWNEAFHRRAVVIPDEGALPRIVRQDGLALTLLGPDRSQLAKLAKVWEDVVAEEEQATGERQEGDLLGRGDPWPPDLAALAQRRFRPDVGEANGSSIAFLVEYQGKCILCAADAFSGRLINSLDRLPQQEERISLDAFKLSHHGSAKSTSSELLGKVACNQYLISSNGSYFGHPDAEAMARVLLHGGKNPKLVFNYRAEHSERWADRKIRKAPRYTTQYPGVGEQGILIEF
ncbi:ComEC/Rec2 family competence protein [Bradyrhizobium sp. GCM10028915]|uniref:ComEC/Rec2 family competence protein n=1 Tax=Bradyrhizobium sp. GCM10028915 TaxID=3273385 RepID=UPI00360FBCEA